MMKARLGAYLSPLFSGENGVVSLKTKFILMGRCCAARPYSKLPSNYEDEFSELGSLVRKDVPTVLKLMTEKVEFPKKNVNIRKAVECPLPSEGVNVLRDALKESSSAPRIKLEIGTDSFESNLVNKSAPNFKNSSSVTVENVPSVIQLTKLKEAMSNFGKISNASMRKTSSELHCCDIKFESVEARNKSVSTGRITVENFDLPIRPMHVQQQTVMIRITNVSSETADSDVRSTCITCGSLEGFVRKSDGSVDALFSVKDASGVKSIIDRLSNKTVNKCKWSAHLQTKESSSAMATGDDSVQLQFGLEIDSDIEALKGQLCLAHMHAEDLADLHHSILHLQYQPASSKPLNV